MAVATVQTKTKISTDVDLQSAQYTVRSKPRQKFLLM